VDVRIFVAGASGVIGVRLVPLLVADGHEVRGMTRSPGKVELLRELGAEPVVCDVYDAAALREAVASFRPDLVMNQLTDLPDQETPPFTANARMRSEGASNLRDAFAASGAGRLIVQSIAWRSEATAAVVEAFERSTLEAGGVVLRYGRIYGPGTYYEDRLPEHPRIHVDEAAQRTVPALDAPSGVYELVDG
jgi:D-arabinose 1-dehydrogenase-like Zn-dependent alcohol dehydrogenase